MCRYISKVEKEMALKMSLESGLSDTKIAEYTGIRPRTMRGLRQRFQETGEVVREPVVSGRPRLLNSLDATVSVSKYV
jgi:transposase